MKLRKAAMLDIAPVPGAAARRGVTVLMAVSCELSPGGLGWRGVVGHGLHDAPRHRIT